MKNEIDEWEGDKWECYLCCKEDEFDNLPFGYLGNYHPLCEKCADKVLFEENHRDRFRLTYHKNIGDIENLLIHVKQPQPLDKEQILSSLGVDKSWITVIKRNNG